MQIVTKVREATKHLYLAESAPDHNLSTLQKCHDMLVAQRRGERPSEDQLSRMLEELGTLVNKERKAMSVLNTMDTLKQLNKNRPGDAYILQMLSGIRMQTGASTFHHTSTPLKPPQNNEILGPVTGLQYDSFALDAKSGHKPLIFLALHIFETEGLFDQLNLDRNKFKLFISRVQDGYKSVPYHNCIHAADVLQRVHAILKTVAVGSRYMLHSNSTTACCSSTESGFESKRLT